MNNGIESHDHTCTDWKVQCKMKMWAGQDTRNAFGVASKSHHFNGFSVSGDADVRRATQKPEQRNLSPSSVVQEASEATAGIDISI